MLSGRKFGGVLAAFRHSSVLRTLPCYSNSVYSMSPPEVEPPVEFIQHNCPGKQVRAYFPPSIYSCDIANNIKAHKGKVTLLEKNYNKFVTAQMDDTVTDGDKVYTKPDKWK